MTDDRLMAPIQLLVLAGALIPEQHREIDGDNMRSASAADMSAHHALDARRSVEALAIHMQTQEFGIEARGPEYA